MQKTTNGIDFSFDKWSGMAKNPSAVFEEMRLVQGVAESAESATRRRIEDLQ